MDSIPSPSPSVKIQIMGRKFCLRHKGKTFCFHKFIDNAQQYFAFTPQANFPAHYLNFHWRLRWWDWIFSTLLYQHYVFSFWNEYFSTKKPNLITIHWVFFSFQIMIFIFLAVVYILLINLLIAMMGDTYGFVASIPNEWIR